MVAKLIGDKIHFELDLKNVNQMILSYLSAIEISNKSEATEQDIHDISEEITANWWKQNKNRFIDEDNN